MKKKRKPKVYIPTYKIIILCASVIAVCMTLLLITTIASGSKTDKKREKEVAAKTKNASEKSADNSNEIKSPFFSDSTPTNNEKSKKKSLAVQEIPPESKNDIKPAQKTESKTSEIQIKTTQTKTSEPKTEAKQEPKAEPVKTSETKSPEPKASETKNAANTNIKTVETSPKVQEQKNVPSKPSFNFPAAVNKAQLVFVFDDGGQNTEHLKKFLSLPFPITVAVLPQITHSRESAEMVRKSGNELILHQPMQALNAKVNPGPGAITPEMTEDEIMSMLFLNINELGQIAGMNNHEGSAITADAEKMSIILKVASENGIYFLDSRTNSESKVPYVASELGYSYYERNIFLDNTKKREDILAELTKGLGIANKNGVAIMIGHIWSADVLPDLLKEIYPELKEKGYTFATVSNSRGKK